MKKTILIVGTFLLGAGFIFIKSLEEKLPMADLLVANIEALTKNEGGETFTCDNSIRQKDGNSVFYCGTCDWVSNSEPSAWSSQQTCKKN